MKATKVNYGTLHRIAFCNDCDWQDGFCGTRDSIERVARAAKRHAENNGHDVVVESGNTFEYKVK